MTSTTTTVSVLHHLQRDLQNVESSLHFMCKKAALFKKQSMGKDSLLHLSDDSNMLLESSKSSNIVCFEEWRFNMRKTFQQLWGEELSKFNTLLQQHLTTVIAQCKLELDTQLKAMEAAKQQQQQYNNNNLTIANSSSRPGSRSSSRQGSRPGSAIPLQQHSDVTNAIETLEEYEASLLKQFNLMEMMQRQPSVQQQHRTSSRQDHSTRLAAQAQQQQQKEHDYSDFDATSTGTRTPSTVHTTITHTTAGVRPSSVNIPSMETLQRHEEQLNALRNKEMIIKHLKTLEYNEATINDIVRKLAAFSTRVGGTLTFTTSLHSSPLTLQHYQQGEDNDEDKNNTITTTKSSLAVGTFTPAGALLQHLIDEQISKLQGKLATFETVKARTLENKQLDFEKLEARFQEMERKIQYIHRSLSKPAEVARLQQQMQYQQQKELEEAQKQVLYNSPSKMNSHADAAVNFNSSDTNNNTNNQYLNLSSLKFVSSIASNKKSSLVTLTHNNVFGTEPPSSNISGVATASSMHSSLDKSLISKASSGKRTYATTAASKSMSSMSQLLSQQNANNVTSTTIRPFSSSSAGNNTTLMQRPATGTTSVSTAGRKSSKIKKLNEEPAVQAETAKNAFEYEEEQEHQAAFIPLLKEIPGSAQRAVSPFREAMSFNEFWVTPRLHQLSGNDIISSDQAALEDAVAQDDDGMSELIT